MVDKASNRTRWELLPVIMALAWPTMLEQLLQTTVQYIDTAMVGSLGTAVTAAVGATGTINWLISGTVSALGVGFLAMLAQADGAQNRTQTAKVAAQAVLVVLVAGIFFTVVTLSVSPYIPVWMQAEESIRSMASRYFFILYLPMLPRTATIIFGTALRAVGDTKTPMWIGLGVNMLNVILNPLLIYPTRQLVLLGYTVVLPGLGWGVEGAAIASAVAFAAGGVCMTIQFWKNPILCPGSTKITLDWAVLKPCLRIAFPNMLQRFGTSMGYVVFASLINGLGAVATAANTIANTVESAFYIPGYGMQTAAATLVGNAYGAKDKNRMQSVSRLLISLEVGLMLVSGGLLFAFAPNMMGIFSDSPEVIALGTTVLRMVAVSEPFFGVTIIIQGILQGVGNTKTAFWFDVSCMWGVRILGTLLCTGLWHMGLVSAWACMICHNLVLFGLFIAYYKRGCWNTLN